MSKYIVVDLETSIKNRGEESIGNMKASSFHPDNKIVWFGAKSDNMGEGCLINLMKEHEGITFSSIDYPLIVGHNIGFDLLYLLKENKESINTWMKEGRIWDTMIVEYLLSGQLEKMPSLDKCSEKRGLPLKDNKIKEYWEKDIDTEDIPYSEINSYLEQDVLNTEKVFLSQLEKAIEMDMMQVVFDAMEARLATIDMEFNGMTFDKKECQLATNDMKEEFSALKREIEILMEKAFGTNVGINVESNEQISLLLFGGKYKYETIEEMISPEGEKILYKSGARQGEQRYKKVSHTNPVVTFTILKRFAVPTKKAGIYQTGDDILENILYNTTRTDVISLVTKILTYRAYSKDLNSFYIPYANLVWPDGCIHPTYNHAVTATTRLSCSSPNLQQVSSKDD